jgi:hypothetical protein
MPVDKQVVAREAVFHVAVTALAQIVLFKDYERNLEALFRIRRTDPTTPDSLDRFLRAHAAVDALSLAPALVQPDIDGSQAAKVEMDIGIMVHHVHVRNAWEIGPHDMDMVAIHEDDHPIIPENVKDAPVLKLIHNRRAN